MANLKNIMTICCHDLLDQVRDRRTLFMIIILPLILYPLAGELIVNLAVGQQMRPKNIVVINAPEVLSNSSAPLNSKLLITFPPSFSFSSSIPSYLPFYLETTQL